MLETPNGFHLIAVGNFHQDAKATCNPAIAVLDEETRSAGDALRG
jgi:hypothetical protein